MNKGDYVRVVSLMQKGILVYVSMHECIVRILGTITFVQHDDLELININKGHACVS
jgi:dsDNA-specific endonuclease/ATPase MutS2